MKNIKNNKFFKVAAIMVILCLVTACVIGTTFAKYVTGDSTGDSAKVAKWGVKISIDGDDLFVNEYEKAPSSVTVKSTGDVVAPGTSGSARFSISGTPEVSATINVALTGISDIMLPAGSFDGLTENYYPVVFTLKQTHNRNGLIVDENDIEAPVTLVSGTLAEIQAFLNTYNASATYAPNTKLDSGYELSWVWAYDSGNDTYNTADTLLGDIIAGEISVTGAQTTVAYSLTITVTQVD